MNTPDLLVIDPGDNVATALRDLDRGAARVSGVDGDLGVVTISLPIRLGHKIALAAIPFHANVIKHGQPIGRATADIRAGDHVHVHNVESLSVDDGEMGNGKWEIARQVANNLPIVPPHSAPDSGPSTSDPILRFSGYLRPDGQVGIRNRLLVLFTVVCAEEVARRVAMQLDDAVVAGWRDCMVSPQAQQKMLRLAANPNVGAVLVMSLGCECTDAPEIAQAIAEMGKPVSLVSIQAAGGTRAAIEQAVIRGRALMAEPFERRAMTVADLIVGVECGGSDTTSGLAANPALGLASDAVVCAGGTVIFEETNELLGCEDSLTRQASSPAVAAAIAEAIRTARRWGARTGQRAISAGNIEGGLTTIEEKSLGAVCKAGSTPVTSVLRGGRWDRPSDPGLHLLAPFYVEEDGWTGAGTISDPNGVTELAACGAHMVVFTTGRGTVTGSGIVPVIKVCGNPETYARMTDNMDINAGAIVAGEKSLSEVGNEIFDAILRTANGELTRAEELGHFEFHI